MIKCPTCGRRTKIEYDNTPKHQNACVRIRECTQGHKCKTIELIKNDYVSLCRIRARFQQSEEPFSQAMEELNKLLGDK